MRSVSEALERELAAMPQELRESTLAATAMSLADALDDPDNSATSKSMCGRVMLDILDRLRELAPPQQQTTQLDDIRNRRQQRLGLAASQD